MSDSKDTVAHGPTTVRAALYVMRSVLMQVGGLAGIFAFLVEMWNRATLEDAIYQGVIVGGGVYLVLLLVDFALEQIVLAERKARHRNAGKSSANGEDSEEKTKVPARGTRKKEDDAEPPRPESGDDGPRPDGETDRNDPAPSDDSSATPSSPDPEQLAAV